MPTIHLYVPDGINVLIHPSAEDFVRITRADQASASDPTPPVVNPQVAQFLDDFERHAERYGNTTAARRVYEVLVERGWVAEPIQHRDTGRTTRKYVHLTYTGAAFKRPVTLYLNTINLTCAGRDFTAYAATLPGADKRPSNNNVVFRHADDVQQALDAADALQRFADDPAAA